MGFFRFYTAVQNCLNYLFTMERDANILVPRLFITPTAHNKARTAKELFIATDAYLNSLTLHTRTHLMVDRGCDKGWNLHEHGIVMVHRDELAEFDERYKTFCNETAYRIPVGNINVSCGNIQVRDFDEALILQAFNYLGNHEAIPEQYNRQVYCSNRYARCKKDKLICRYDKNNPILLKGRLT